jgi:hypothetical protein
MKMANEPGRPENKNRDTLVVDLGSKKKKQIKQLRKGKGKLMDKVNQCLNELKTSGSISGSVQPVVIVVREKASVGESLMDMMR